MTDGYLALAVWVDNLYGFGASASDAIKVFSDMEEALDTRWKLMYGMDSRAQGHLHKTLMGGMQVMRFRCWGTFSPQMAFLRPVGRIRRKRYGGVSSLILVLQLKTHH